MRYFSTFSGIGGFELGIIKAYVETTNRTENMGSEKIETIENSERYTQSKSSSTERRQPSEHNNCHSESRQERLTCVGYSEIDKYATAIYQKHFPNHKNYGDITKINADELPDFDLLVGGFPCQAFSIAGKRRGFEDTRGTMFFELARILKAKQPRLFVFENVKGLLSHDNGNTFKTIISTIAELGYDCQWQVLNSKNFGVPQNRERVFIVGHLRGTSRPKVFPIRANGEISDAQKRQVSRGVSVEQSPRVESDNQSQLLQDGENGHIHQINQPKHSNERVYGKDGISPTLNTMQGGNRQPFVLETEMKIRRLTPTECERLQGFPDGWTEGVSDTQRYKTLGNAVTINVVEEVIKRII